MIIQTARSPIVCLPYQQRHKAIGKELIIDYSTGNVYHMSEDRTRLIDITKTIADKIDTISSGHITVDIDGNPVDLTQIINQVMTAVDNTIVATDPGDSVFFSGDKRTDNLSVETKFNRIQIKGFGNARDKTIPMKENGVISWVSFSEGGTPGDPDNTDGDISTRVLYVEPFNGRIYLNATKKQVTTNMRENAVVILPKVYDEFSEIWWNVKTYSFQPTITFTNNMIFKSYESVQPKADCYQTYKFTTWDSGNTWFGELVVFGQTDLDDDTGNSDVTKEWIEDNYYTKSTVEEMYVSKLYATTNYFNKTEAYNIFALKDDQGGGSLDEDRVREIVTEYASWSIL